MAIQSFFKDVSYGENVTITVMSNDEISKEVRIVFKTGQEMSEHKAPFPISVMTLKGSIAFAYDDESLVLESGDMIKLDAHVVHALKAREDSIVQLTLNKNDTIKRVEGVETH